MMQRRISVRRPRAATTVAAAALMILAPPALAQSPKIGDPPEAKNMRLVGYNDLHGRSAYQPTIHHQGSRYIAYVGHHGGTPEVPQPINRLTGQAENNGTSIVDVTDPSQPKYLAHIPGLQGHYQEAGAQGNRGYFGYGTNKGGVLQIVDREKLLNGPKEPTAENLRYPVVGQVDMLPFNGAHTVFPMLKMPVAEFAKDKDGKVRDFVMIVDEQILNECQEP